MTGEVGKDVQGAALTAVILVRQSLMSWKTMKKVRFEARAGCRPQEVHDWLQMKTVMACPREG